MDELLLHWHAYRVPFALTVLIVVGVIRLFLFLRRRALHSQNPRLDIARQQKQSAIFNKGSFVAKIESRDPLREDFNQTRTAVKKNPPKRIVGKRLNKPHGNGGQAQSGICRIQPLVFYASLSGTTEKAAQSLVDTLWTSLGDDTADQGDLPIFRPKLLDLSYIEYDDYFTAVPAAPVSEGPLRYFYLVVLPTYDVDTVLNTYLLHLEETHHDFRVDSEPLRELAGYSVFGFGDKSGWPTEEQGFCSQAREVDVWLSRLTGRKRAYPLGVGDTSSDSEIRLKEWSDGIQHVLRDLAAGLSLGEGIPGSGDALESDEEDAETPTKTNKLYTNLKRKDEKTSNIADLEGLGVAVRADGDALMPKDFTTYGRPRNQSSQQPPKEMVPKSSPTYAALTKQGYTVVGSHSGVKICRWTKSALRGRGSCYKFSFYGIKSHLCMETTPSLSCSNKCVFCWRHGTNPVGTTWRWKVDQPDVIFAGVKEGHYKKIKMMRGVPGVRAERFEEAMRIRHCALSLVGEPIFYPHINEFTALLHKEHISSFLVCNAQHPDQLATLRPVTQLYVSIDASNRESLRKIDRPLHRDFWERFCRCLDIIREKRFRQRTVYRLTLVKGFNIEDEAEGYAHLVEKGLPCFVEIKGVTYCGTSASSSAGLTMQNVPFYEEVCAFVEALNLALARRGLDYGVAAEHAHSCCVLIASKRFLAGGKWHTTIDYDAFFRCLESGEDFAPEDYMAPTPEWALWGNGGFDPADERVYRKGAKKAQARLEAESGVA